MIKKLFVIFIILIILWFGLSLIPFERDSKDLKEIIGNEQVHNILKRACFDCHSYQTKWPWYSYAFPTNFFIYHHVKKGRESLNFHTWNELSITKQSINIDNIIESIESGEMPLKSYLLLHPQAQITERDLNILREWQKEIETEIQDIEVDDDE